MWLRIDDRLHSHPKIRRAWQANRDAVGLHFLALSYVADKLTDGYVDLTFLRDQFPEMAEAQRAVAVLVSAGLWETSGEGWVIHDWLRYNDSAAGIRARREAREAKRALNRRLLDEADRRGPRPPGTGR